MIYTSSYKDFKSDKYRLVSISKDKGASYIDENGNPYDKECYLALAPKRDFFKQWRILKEEVSFEESTLFYMRHFYDEVLLPLDPKQVYKDLNHSVLLCYEDSSDFCHRHIVAAWFELLLGFEIPEVKIVDNQMTFVERPKYIKNYLENIIKEKKSLIKK